MREIGNILGRSIDVIRKTTIFLTKPKQIELARSLSTVKQLTLQDAVFLSIETPSLPAHIGGLAFLEPVEGFDFSFESFRHFVRERFTECDRFGSRVELVPFGLDRPYWVRVDAFDAADHVDRVSAPEPYSAEALSRLVGRLFERPLDKSRPLWEMTLIEGLPGGGHVLLWKIHHCMMDGSSGAGLVEQLFDLKPDAVRPPTRIEGPLLDGKPRDLEMALRAIGNAIELPRRSGPLLRLRPPVAGEHSVWMCPDGF